MLKTFKNLFLLLIVLAMFFGFTSSALADNEEKKPEGQVLELAYPVIPGAITPKTVSEGLPNFINYIFRLAMAMMGIVIFLVLIYNGFLWFTSAGNADKLKTAKDGITGAFLGAIILFSAYIIFNTINPQLTILELDDPDAVEPIIIPGIYICDYDIEDTGKDDTLPRLYDVINSYTKGTIAEDSKAVKKAVELFKLFVKNKYGTCFRIGVSGNFHNFTFTPQGGTKYITSGNYGGGNVPIPKHSFFQIPEKKYKYNETAQKVETFWHYNYGVIFHQNKDYKGKCKVYAYDDRLDIHPEMGFYSSSATVFKKNENEPDPSSKGIVLWNCIELGEAGASYCPEEITSPGKLNALSMSEPGIQNLFSASALPYITGTDNLKLNEKTDLEENIRSVLVDPEGYYFAVLFEKDNFDGSNGICEVITKTDNNLMDNPIGRCGKDCNQVINKNVGNEEVLKKCAPCAKSVLTIRGDVF